MSEAIAFCKIFPPFGIARLGNSNEPDGFFIGPEGLGPVTAATEPLSFKDRHGAVLRQAARFRVYGFDEAGKLGREVTTTESSSIRWTVLLANMKASWFAFDGAANAQQQVDGSEAILSVLRNASVRKNRDALNIVSDGFLSIYSCNSWDRQTLQRLFVCRQVPRILGRLPRQTRTVGCSSSAAAGIRLRLMRMATTFRRSDGSRNTPTTTSSMTIPVTAQ